MKKHMLTFALLGALAASPGIAAAQAMDPNMPGMQHDAHAPDAQGTGVVKAIDTSRGTVTLQHQAIAAIGWPAMTMAFKVAAPDLLNAVKVGDQVQFSLRPAGMDSTVTAIKPVQR